MVEINIEKILTTVTIVITSFVAVVFVIISIILNYHWKKYIIDISQVEKIRIFYFGISLALGVLITLTLLGILL